MNRSGRGIRGIIMPAGSFFLKHPPQKMRDEGAWEKLEEFIRD